MIGKITVEMYQFIRTVDAYPKILNSVLITLGTLLNGTLYFVLTKMDFWWLEALPKFIKKLSEINLSLQV